MTDPERLGAIFGEVLLAAGLGAFGTIARLAATDRPMLTASFLLHVLAGGSLGTGPLLMARAVELEGWWLFAVPWLAGTLGYAALHDLLLRLLSRRLGGP